MVRRVAVAGLLAGGMAVGAFAPAAVGSPTASAAGSQLVVKATMTSSKIRLSTGGTIAAGATKFKVVSGDGKDHALQIARLHKGYSLQQAQQDLGKAFSGNVPAIRRIDDNVTFKGGAEAHHKNGYFSVSLAAGKYYLFDQNANTVRTLHVVGKIHHRSVPRTVGTIKAFSYGFGTSGRLPARGWVRLYDQSDQPHFYVFQRVKASTTHRQVKKFLASGAQGNPPWALKANVSSGVISPYRGQGFRLNLPAGKYVVLCFWPDDDTGMPHAFMGMWKIIHLR